MKNTKKKATGTTMAIIVDGDILLPASRVYITTQNTDIPISVTSKQPWSNSKMLLVKYKNHKWVFSFKHNTPESGLNYEYNQIMQSYKMDLYTCDKSKVTKGDKKDVGSHVKV